MKALQEKSSNLEQKNIEYLAKIESLEKYIEKVELA
jgi:hypothetical protein